VRLMALLAGCLLRIRAMLEDFWLNNYSIMSFVQSPRFLCTLPALVCTKSSDCCSTSAKQHDCGPSSLSNTLCRKVLGVRAFLCIWHIMRAWQKKLWQLMGMRSKDAFHDIVERMQAIMEIEMQATAHEARMVEVNAVMDTTLEASEVESQRKAAENLKHWRKKTGEPLNVLQQ
jgi:hypothetical protein